MEVLQRVSQFRIDPITIRDLTAGKDTLPDGTGVFDQLMLATAAHLKEEYVEQRITGDKYADAYISMVQAVLGASVQYTVSSYNANMQRELTQQELDRIVAQTEMIRAELLNVPKQGLILDAQKSNLDAQKLNLDEDIKIKGKQILKLDADISFTGKQEQMVDKQILTETAMTTEPTGGIRKAEYDNILKQGLQIDSSIALTEQKKKTEQSNILDNVDGAPVSGLVGWKNKISETQVKAFETENMAKTIKACTDGFAVVQSVDVTDTKDEETGKLLKIIPDTYKQPAIDEAIQTLWKSVGDGTALPINPTP